MVFYSFNYTIRDFIKLQLCVVGALRNHYFRLFHSIHFPCSISTADRRTDVWSRPSCIYTQIFSPKKTGFPKKFRLLFTFILCNFSVQTLKSFFLNLNQFFVHKNFKKQASKVANNHPDPFI